MPALAQAYVGLKDIDETVPLNPLDAPCLEEIRSILLKYDALDRFGVTLLHSHFPVYDGEFLLERSDEETRSLTITTVPAANPTQSAVVETSWRFGATGEVIAAMTCGNACVVSGGSHKKQHVKVNPVG